MKKNISRGICLGVMLLGLTGCGNSTPDRSIETGQMEPVSKENTITYQLLDAPELNYEIPELKPGLCVPSGGYDVAEEKKANAYGTILPKEFYLLEEDTHEIVYTGAFSEVRYHKDTGSYSGVADFTEFTGTGEYLLKCDYLGYSYPFIITEHLQENMLSEMVEGFEALLAGEKDDRSKADGVLTLILSYEFYAGAYETTEGEVPRVLQIVHSYVDGLMESLGEEEAQLEEPYMMIALLSKYGNCYQAFDWNQGNDAIKLAKKLWKEAEKTEQESDYRILAAAELYKATGTYSYRKLVQDYFDAKAESESEKMLESRYDIFAALTHFTTAYKVNRALCTSLMEELLKQAEEVYSYISLDNQLLDLGSDEEKLDEIMWNMVTVSVVEYVITNYEYGDLLEEEYFYLQGRNPRSMDYVNEMIVKEPRLQAAYVMLLCEHLAHEHLK